MLPGSQRQVVLQKLLPDTRYSILVTAEYRNKEGGTGSAQGKTSQSRRAATCPSLISVQELVTLCR